MSITFNGIGSGLDIDSIVGAIVDAERAPAENRLNRLESSTTEELSAIGQLNSALSNFLDAVDELGDEDLYQGRTVSIGDRDLVAASADETAQTGNYQLQIESIASAHKVATQAVASGTTEVGTGTLTIHLGSSSFDVEIDSDNNSLAEIRNAINNSEANIGVTASIINDDTGARLVLTSDQTGVDNLVSVTAADDDGNDRDLAGLSQLVYDPNDVNALGDGGVVHDGLELAEASNATVYIDGLTVTSASNTIDNVIEGVSIDLLGAQDSDDFSAGNTINISVQNDTGSIKDSVNEFVSVYNGFLDVVEQLTLVVVNDGNTGNLTGALTGDSTVRSLLSNIRSQLSTGVDDNPDGLQFLVNLGISTDEDGRLTVDDSLLDEALAENFSSVGNLFAGDSGLSERLTNSLAGYTGSGGVLELRRDSLQNRLNDVDEQREELERRIAITEARFYSQYQAADSLIGNLNNTLSFLSTSLLNNNISRNNNNS